MNTATATATTARPLYAIARDIARDWAKPNYAAVPYLDAMCGLSDISDRFYYDSADSVVRYFLANAGQWRGPVAREIKAELKAMLAR
jgi:hypothetical protein